MKTASTARSWQGRVSSTRPGRDNERALQQTFSGSWCSCRADARQTPEGSLPISRASASFLLATHRKISPRTPKMTTKAANSAARTLLGDLGWIANPTPSTNGKTNNILPSKRICFPVASNFCTEAPFSKANCAGLTPRAFAFRQRIARSTPTNKIPTARNMLYEACMVRD